MATWQCVTGCGACCNLDPSDRPDLADYLTPEELDHYLSLVGEGGWCINFDHDTRKCRIYEQRPRFCRVTPETFEQMYGVERTEFNDFAIECCQQQIAGVHGENSPEMERYNQEVGEGFDYPLAQGEGERGGESSGSLEDTSVGADF